MLVDIWAIKNQWEGYRFRNLKVIFTKPVVVTRISNPAQLPTHVMREKLHRNSIGHSNPVNKYNFFGHRHGIEHGHIPKVKTNNHSQN